MAVCKKEKIHSVLINCQTSFTCIVKELQMGELVKEATGESVAVLTKEFPTRDVGNSEKA